MLTPDEETVVFNKTTTIPRLTQGLTQLIKALKQRHAAAPEVPADLADLPDDADLAL